MASDIAPAPRTARARARVELTQEIKDSARRQLATEGAAGLSLRAVSRDLGMVSSAVYRYFPSRDELLTALIVDAYLSIGEAAEEALTGALSVGADHGTRWLTVCRAVRSWALENRHEWALVYGSPVVDYVAPQETIEPAGRIALVLAQIARDALEAGVLAPPTRVVRHDLVADPIAEIIGGRPDAPFADLPERALSTWSNLVGSINFELFGHLQNVVSDFSDYFDVAMILAAERIGLAVPHPS